MIPDKNPALPRSCPRCSTGPCASSRSQASTQEQNDGVRNVRRSGTGHGRHDGLQEGGPRRRRCPQPGVGHAADPMPGLNAPPARRVCSEEVSGTLRGSGCCNGHDKGVEVRRVTFAVLGCCLGVLGLAACGQSTATKGAAATKGAPAAARARKHRGSARPRTRPPTRRLSTSVLER